eukprot:CAMPEP_0183309042 /NCGR_PEP_ID=MMETSP0160_2-20130417/23661_1 /TAXON_ID=2839 ORGANISM="Odontella Sinensis, Strain Grunow 1884" /NCGR_SAMPLE_ID=MMETSP0160_2 /ASSEMBLY_ACC=CAM_ASM_000250 /LENGTH=349 /DNA_ID=CAMNT_0025472983 /DNA_START=96 /DNA_END=1145 /DNA_ORIENTATION=+
MTNAPQSSPNVSTYSVRPFETTSDLPHLEEICRDVYDGTDYLPKTAPSIVADPSCSFVVLTRENNESLENGMGGVEKNSVGVPLAVANLRRSHLPGVCWLEAVRTSNAHRNRGLAKSIVTKLLDDASSYGEDTLTCTVKSNIAMRKVLEGAGMKVLGQIHIGSFSALKELPGWGADDTNRETKPLLSALGIDDLVGEEAQSMQWKAVRTREELERALSLVKEAGGSGYMPGTWELVSEEVLEESLRKGLIYQMKGGYDRRDAAVIAFVRDERIQSLRSPWVCSVAATTSAAADAAIWRACAPGLPPVLPGGHVGFVPVIDGAVPIETTGSLCASLPLDSECVLYGTRRS